MEAPRSKKWKKGCAALGLQIPLSRQLRPSPQPQTNTSIPIFTTSAAGRTLPLEAAWVLLGLCSYPRGISTPPSPPEPEEAIMKLTGDKTSHRGTVGHLSFSNAVLFLPIWLQLVQRYNFQNCSFLVDHTIKVFEKQTAPNHGTVRSPFSNLWPIFPEQTQSCSQDSQKARAERQELLFNVIT